MDNILVLQYNMDKVSIDMVREIYESVQGYLENLYTQPKLVALPDGMSLMTCSLDRLRGFRDGLNRLIGELKEEQ